MSLPDFKTQIENIRKEILEMGISTNTIYGYEKIWRQYAKWKNEEYFFYNEKEYSIFLQEHYHFDIESQLLNLTKWQRHLANSKKILDNFNEYKQKKLKIMFPESLYNAIPKHWNEIIESYLIYLKDVRQNGKTSIRIKKDYLKRELSYFYQKGLNNLSDLSPKYINLYLNDTIHAGNISKRRYFYVLRDFLTYLFIEGILKEDLSVYIPSVRSKERVKLPTYIKPEKIEELLNIIPKEKKIEKRNYAIILIAARLGLRISDILNIKLKDIDWQNNKFSVIQPKTNHLNILPLSKEVGWAIINYIKVRPKCDNEYLFIKYKYPFEKLNHFNEFNKYFDKVNIKVENDNKKGIHNLRHSLAINMLENEVPLSIIASTIGDSIEMTSNTYLKVDIKSLKSTTMEVNE